MRSRVHFHQFKKWAHLIGLIIGWATFSHIFWNIPPQTWQHIYFAPFFIVFYLCIALTLGLVIHNNIAVLLIPGAIVAILCLRMIGIKDWVNPILIICLTGTLIYFFTVSEKSDKLTTPTSIKQTDSPAQPDNHASLKTPA